MEEKTKKRLKAAGKMALGCGETVWGVTKWGFTKIAGTAAVALVSMVDKNTGKVLQKQIIYSKKNGTYQTTADQIIGDSIDHGVDTVKKGLSEFKDAK